MTYVDSGIRHEDLKFKDDVLLCQGKDTKWRIHRDMVQPHLFWIIFEDGGHSADYYNLTRAKENAKNLYLAERNNVVPEASSEPVDAFK